MTKTNATKKVEKKTMVKKTVVRKTSPVREAFTTLVTVLKTQTAEKKARKAELLKKVDALWAEYRNYVKTEYKTKRAEAVLAFEAVKKDVAAKRAERKIEAINKRADKRAAKAVAKKAVKKVAEKAATEPETK